MNRQLPIGEGTEVKLHFALKLESGEVVDSNFDQEPATFTVGDGNLLQGFEQALFGLTAGARQTFTITPEQGFGQKNPENVQHFSREQFGEEIVLEEGLILSFADAQNAELPGVVVGFDEATVIVDFNHPLAGKPIQFEVEIIAVTPAVKH